MYAVRDEISGELVCSRCSRTFVELSGQGIENYIPIPHAPEIAHQAIVSGDAAIPATPVHLNNSFISAQNPSGDIFRTLSRLLGLGSQNAEPNRPVAIVLRQSGSQGGLGLLSSLLAGQQLNQDGNEATNGGLTENLESMLGGGSRSFEDILHHLMMTETSHANRPASASSIASLSRYIVDKNTGKLKYTRFFLKMKFQVFSQKLTPNFSLFPPSFM